MKFAALALLGATAQAGWSSRRGMDYDYGYCKVYTGREDFGGYAYFSQYTDSEGLSDIMVRSYWYNVPEVPGIIFKVFDNEDCSDTPLASYDTSVRALWTEGSYKVSTTFDGGEDLDDLLTDGGAISINVDDEGETFVACCTLMDKSWGYRRELQEEFEQN